MSFILDALKKIEQEKRRETPGAAERFALAYRNPSRLRQVVSMGLIALGSAVVTALALSMFSNEPGDRNAEPDSANASSELVAPAEPLALEPITVLEPLEATPSEPEPDGPLESEPDGPTRVKGQPAPVNEKLPVPDSEKVAAEEPTQEDELAKKEDAPPAEEPAGNELPESEPSAIRLVGRDRAARGVEPDEPQPAPGEAQAPPEDFPQLVLQGTSVLGDRAVAVISDQRVFEGDRIRGALVVRIGEREVELELDGRRFVLRL